MGNLTNEVLRPIIDAINVPLILGLCLVVVIAVTGTASSLWYLVEHRGRRPLMIRMGGATGGNQNSAEHTSLDDRLLAYLAADGQGGYVIAPGAGGPAAPGVTTEALEPSHGWPAALLRLAIAREPSYLVDVSWPRDDDTAAERRAVVRISRVPGDRVVASGSFTAGSDSELVEIVGCFCITFLRGQPRILRHTPRWERWSQDINGYRAYRDGLEHQRRGMVTRSIEEYEIAISRFHEAARIEPANMLVQLHRAALLELTHDYDEAVGIYSKCRTLWPEHIEAGYRDRLPEVLVGVLDVGGDQVVHGAEQAVQGGRRDTGPGRQQVDAGGGSLGDRAAHKLRPAGQPARPSTSRVGPGAARGSRPPATAMIRSTRPGRARTCCGNAKTPAISMYARKTSASWAMAATIARRILAAGSAGTGSVRASMSASISARRARSNSTVARYHGGERGTGNASASADADRHQRTGTDGVVELGPADANDRHGFGDGQQVVGHDDLPPGRAG